MSTAHERMLFRGSAERFIDNIVDAEVRVEFFSLLDAWVEYGHHPGLFKGANPEAVSLFKEFLADAGFIDETEW